MLLTNFYLESDNIALNYNGHYLDLHNNFEFRGYSYDTTSNQMEFIWTRSHEDWVNEELCGLTLVFRGIRLMRIRERDSSIPLTENRCLSDIGFIWPDMRDDFDSFMDTRDITDKDDMNIVFQSGQAFKINCDSARLVELQEEVIYVRIVNESVDIWRPMWADRLEEGVYRIKSFPDYDSSDELQFKTGDIVVCEVQKKLEERVLVAVSRK